MFAQYFRADKTLPDQMPANSQAKGYRFRPLAGTEEAFMEELNLDPERQRLRDVIFAKFGKSQI